ncbi:MAG: serine hydrolase [Gammaproteobacteria bacterium]
MGDNRTTKKVLKALLVTALLFCQSAFADGYDDAPSLRESHDPGLQRQIETRIERLGLAEAVANKKLCLAFVDISDKQEPRVADLNGDHMMYAASLPKIGILLGAFVEIERGRLELDDDTFESLSRMIRHSSNNDATAVLNKVGKFRVNRILKSERFRLYDPLVNGGLWVGKEYARGKAFQRDPLHNLSHGATALQTARFYYLLESNRLVNKRLSKEMKKILANPGISHKFVKGLEHVDNVKFYRKSGTWRNWHADSALVEHGEHRYIIVALAESDEGGDWLADIARSFHELVVPTKYATIR